MPVLQMLQRHQQHIHQPGLPELAAQLDVKPMWIYRQIRSKKINPKHVMQHPHRKVILVCDCPEVIDKLQELM